MILRVSKRLSPVRDQSRYKVVSDNRSASGDDLQALLQVVKREEYLPIIDHALIALREKLDQIHAPRSKLVVEISIT